MSRRGIIIQNILRCRQWSSAACDSNSSGQQQQHFVVATKSSCISSHVNRNCIRGMNSSTKVQSDSGNSCGTDCDGSNVGVGVSSSVIDSLEASSNWRRGQLSKLSDKFDVQNSNHNSSSNNSNDNNNNDRNKNNSNDDNNDGGFDIIDMSEPMKINSDAEVQQMWKEMENRVTRRRTLTVAEAIVSGKGVGRKNLRKTDEEAWLEAGLYDERVDK